MNLDKVIPLLPFIASYVSIEYIEDFVVVLNRATFRSSFGCFISGDIVEYLEVDLSTGRLAELNDKGRIARSVTVVLTEKSSMDRR